MDLDLRPDPARGVFGTMLVVDGTPVELEAHLARLSRSVGELYGLVLPACARADVHAHARPLAHGRLRVSVVPRVGGDAELAVVAEAIDPAIVLPGPERALDLAARPVRRWPGAHKWVDRRLLEQLDAEVAPAMALLVDEDVGVLETTRANVFCVDHAGVLRTPRADGNLLPGIARARVIDIARRAGLDVREERLTRADLLAAREVFVTGSVRGIEPVRTLDGVALADASDVRPILKRELAVRWLGTACA